MPLKYMTEFALHQHGQRGMIHKVTLGQVVTHVLKTKLQFYLSPHTKYELKGD